MKGKLMMNGTLTGHDRPTNRTDDRVPGLRGYARIGKRGCAPIEVYFMVDDAAGVSRHTFSIHKHGFGHAYLLATERYSALHNLSMLEEMDVLGKMPDKDELCSHMAQSLLYRGVDIEEGELLGYLT